MEAPYRQVLRDMRRRLATGDWPPGHRIPSRGDLAQQYGVSPGVIRLATDVLRRRGELVGHQRSRLVAAHPVSVRTLTDPDAEWPYALGERAAGTCRADEHLAGRLSVPVGTRLHWDRTECLDPDQRPSHLVTSWWRGGSAPAWVRSAAEAGLHQLTASEGEHLGMVAGVLALLVRRTRFGADGRPVETADLVLPADRWRVRLT